MTPIKDSKITDYINKQPSPQKDILKKVRGIFMKTISHCEEKMAWGVVSFDDNKFYIVGLKDSVNVGFAIKGLDPDEIKLFEGNAKTMRHIKIKILEEIDEKRLVKLIKLVHKKAVCSKC